MTANLPPGFDPGVWQGWENVTTCTVHSTMKRSVAGRDVFVTYWIEAVGNQWSVCTGPYKHFPTESEAAAFCQKYADEHGGWQA